MLKAPARPLGQPEQLARAVQCQEDRLDLQGRLLKGRSLMPAIKQTVATAATPSYHVADAAGNAVRLSQQDGNLKISVGGTSFTLTQQNVTDLLSALTAYSNTGRLS